MVYYVAHKYGGNAQNMKRAATVTHDLQIGDKENTYFCPLVAFSHLSYGELGWEDEMALCIDMLSVCDKLIVASEISEGVSQEIEFARMVGMEVEYLENRLGEV